MNHKTCLAMLLCVTLSLGCAATALADEEEGATAMEGTSAVMVTLEAGAIRQEIPIPSVGDEADAPGVADGNPIRNLRHIQALLRTGDAPTLALASMLALVSGMLACALYLDGKCDLPSRLRKNNTPSKTREPHRRSA